MKYLRRSQAASGPWNRNRIPRSPESNRPRACRGSSRDGRAAQEPRIDQPFSARAIGAISTMPRRGFTPQGGEQPERTKPRPTSVAAVGEVHDARGAVLQREPQRDQRIGSAEHRARDNDLHGKVPKSQRRTGADNSAPVLVFRSIPGRLLDRALAPSQPRPLTPWSTPLFPCPTVRLCR